MASPMVRSVRGPLTQRPSPGEMLHIGGFTGLVTEQTITEVRNRPTDSTIYAADFIENDRGHPPVCLALMPNRAPEHA